MRFWGCTGGTWYADKSGQAAGSCAAAAAGEAATHIHCYEVTWIMTIGGGGATLALAIMMAFMSKSQRLRVMGKTCLVPSIFNINEPLVYGTPVAFNAILMLPMWICGLVIPIITWFVFKLGLVPLPTSVFQLWYLPKPIFAYFSTGSISGAILCLVLFAISWIIYYPFFKVYDNQCLKEESEENIKE